MAHKIRVFLTKQIFLDKQRKKGTFSLGQKKRSKKTKKVEINNIKFLANYAGESEGKKVERVSNFRNCRRESINNWLARKCTEKKVDAGKIPW
jgi:hypothetical protein